MEMFSILNGDLDRICRLCFNKSNSIETNIDLITNEKLIETIFDCTTIMIVADDCHRFGLPTKICQICFSRLNNLNQFRKDCILKNKKLLEYLEVNDKTFVVQNMIDGGDDPYVNASINNMENIDESSENEMIEILAIQDSDDHLDDLDFDEKFSIDIENIYSTSQIVDETSPYIQVNSQTMESIKTSVITMTNTSDTSSYSNESNNNTIKNTVNESVNKRNQKLRTNTSGITNNTDKKSASAVSETTTKRKQQIRTKEQRKEYYRQSLRSCDICGKLLEKPRIEAHINRHLGITPFACDVESCSKKFPARFLLQIHKANHHSSKTYQCDLCPQIYNLRKSLYNHRLKHFEPKHNCKHCHRKFKNSTHLKEHMRSHTGERPYKCTKCNGSFTKSYNLKTHLRSHSKERPFVCETCGQSYGYNSLLKLHIAKCHS